jgi:hypothetical protein
LALIAKGISPTIDSQVPMPHAAHFPHSEKYEVTFATLAVVAPDPSRLD